MSDSIVVTVTQSRTTVARKHNNQYAVVFTNAMLKPFLPAITLMWLSFLCDDSNCAPGIVTSSKHSLFLCNDVAVCNTVFSGTNRTLTGTYNALIDILCTVVTTSSHISDTMTGRQFRVVWYRLSVLLCMTYKQYSNHYIWSKIECKHSAIVVQSL